MILALFLGIFAGGFLAYELIALVEELRDKNSGDDHVE